MSLDGFIAGPNGEYDWIVQDPSVDFAALFKEFDTAVMGRKTYDIVRAHFGGGSLPGLDVIVFSRTLSASRRGRVRVLNDDPRRVVAELKSKPGRSIWLFGGGDLFRYLLDGGLVDAVEVAVIPVLLGSGIPVIPPGAQAKLVLAHQKVLPASGIVVLSYGLPGAATPPPIRYVESATATKRGRKTSAVNRGNQKKGRRNK